MYKGIENLFYQRVILQKRMTLTVSSPQCERMDLEENGI